MYGKQKRQKKFPGEAKPKKPMYESLIHLWETSLDNDVNDILGNYTGRPKNDEIPEQDDDDL